VVAAGGVKGGEAVVVGQVYVQTRARAGAQRLNLFVSQSVGESVSR
jgi:hypothetical protein